MFKLIWLIENVESVRIAYENDDLMFGTIDTWFIYKLTGGKSHVTDVSNASRTFMMNIKTLEWDEDILKEFKIKRSCLPKILDSCSLDFGYVSADVFKGQLAHVPVTGVLGD
jgi:glycerol kinase